MPSLVLHPQCAAGSTERLDATVELTTTGCRATFKVIGNIARINFPPRESDGGRFDNLWRTTCFEIFWQPAGGTLYREFNLSPSMRWASYDFDDFRKGMRDAPAEVLIEASASGNEFCLIADIASALTVPATVALNAIIEDADGVNRFWALAFAEGKPEFHSEVCRTLAVGSNSE